MAGITVGALAVDTMACSYVGLVLGPKRAAKHVEAQAGGVFDRVMKPKLERMLGEYLNAHGSAMVAQFERIKAEARADAEARVALAQEALTAQAKEMHAEVEKMAGQMRAQIMEEAEAEKARMLDEAKSLHARALGQASGEARREKNLVAAATETRILAAVTEQLGEVVGPRVMEYARRWVPASWQQAVANPESAGVILGPLVELAQRKMAQAPAQGEQRARVSVSRGDSF